jgi:hypothetical protein
MNDLLCGRVSRFSLDALVNIATATGRRVHMQLESARDVIRLLQQRFYLQEKARRCRVFCSLRHSSFDLLDLGLR